MLKSTQLYIYLSFIYTERSVKLREVERAVGVCKKIVAAFSNSWKRRRELAKAQADQNPPLPPHHLITETPTRWGSMQAMVERVIEQEKALSQVLRADKKTRHLVPTWQDMDVLESMNKASQGVYRCLVWGALPKCFLLETRPPSVQQPDTQASGW